VNDPIRVKITDFGTSRAFQSHLDVAMGTARYSAPEILRKEKSFTEKADVYSCSLLFYEMLSLQTPFDDVQFCYEVEERVIAGESYLLLLFSSF
jgi:serine/threonine protein kinase